MARAHFTDLSELPSAPGLSSAVDWVDDRMGLHLERKMALGLLVCPFTTCRCRQQLTVWELWVVSLSMQMTANESLHANAAQ